jgi:hypothetical protein
MGDLYGFGKLKKESYHPTIKVIEKSMKSERKKMLEAHMRLESIPVQIPREVALVVENVLVAALLPLFFSSMCDNCD